MGEKKTQLLNDIREHLRYIQELGISDYWIEPSASTSLKTDRLQELKNRVLQCQRCRLAETRTQAVPGEGSIFTSLMFVGEGPGHDEDVQGRPFVGKAGQLLTKIIEAMGFQRQNVYITNVVKCRPPQNRNPNQEEMQTCQEYLFEQFDLIKPSVVVTLGNVPTQFLLGTRAGISSLRGTFHDFRDMQIMPTFHPSYLIRNEGNRELKRQVWADMKKVLAYLGGK